MRARYPKGPAGWGPSEAYAELYARLSAGSDLRGEVVPLPTFLEDAGWGDLPLRPRQRLLLKVADNAIHGRELDTGLAVVPLTGVQAVDTEDDPEVSARMARTQAHAVAFDAALGAHVYDERADWEYLIAGHNQYARVISTYQPGGRGSEPLTLVFIMGRGSSKTTYLSAGISAWATYRILSSASPHGMFGLAPVKPLRVQNVATSAVQAGEFFDSFRTIIERVPWFAGRHEPPGVGIIKFEPHLYVERTSSNSRSSRGRDTVVYVHDEIAFADKTQGPRSDRKLYDAIRKAVKTRARGQGLVVVVSSPAEADGVLYELYTQAEAGTFAQAIVVQMATWEAIPGQAKADYAAEYASDGDVADMEYGSQFYSGASNLLPGIATRLPAMEEAYRTLTGLPGPMPLEPLKDANEEAAWKQTQRRYSRVAHVDTSAGGDRTVLVLAHVRERRVVVDLVRAWDREVAFSRELLPFIKRLAARVPLDQVTFDQADSLQLIQDLNDAGITAMKTAFTAQYNDAIARNLKTIVTEGLLALYPLDPEVGLGIERTLATGAWDDDPRLWPQVSMGILHRELAAAKKTVRGAFIAAEAPTAGPVQTDDCLDALMAATYQAMKLAGGLGEFFTVARGPEGLQPSERRELSEGPVADTRRDVLCPHHRGWVSVDARERIVPCPECKGLIQARL